MNSSREVGSSTRHVLTSLGNDPNQSVIISEDTRSNITKSLDIINSITTMEEIFDAALENYFELENELMFIVHREMLFSRENVEAYKINGQISRRIINFTSTARLYIDQLPVQIKNICSGAPNGECHAIKSEISRAYDERLGYRALDALRNYSQHHGYPIHSTMYGSSWSRNATKSQLKHSISPQIDTRKLALDKKFKKSVLAELQALGEMVSFKPLVREYMEGLSEIHAVARDLSDTHLEVAKNNIELARSKYLSQLPLGASYRNDVYVVDNANALNIRDYIYLPGGYELLEHFRSKNRKLLNLSKRHITSED